MDSIVGNKTLIEELWKIKSILQVKLENAIIHEDHYRNAKDFNEDISQTPECIKLAAYWEGISDGMRYSIIRLDTLLEIAQDTQDTED